MRSKHCFFISRARVTIKSLQLVLFVCFLTFLSFVSLLRHGSLNAHRCGHLNIGFPVYGADRKVIGRVAFLEEVHHCSWGMKVKSHTSLPIYSLLHVFSWGCSSQLPTPASMPTASVHAFLPWWTCIHLEPRAQITLHAVSCLDGDVLSQQQKSN